MHPANSGAANLSAPHGLLLENDSENQPMNLRLDHLLEELRSRGGDILAAIDGRMTVAAVREVVRTPDEAREAVEGIGA